MLANRSTPCPASRSHHWPCTVAIVGATGAVGRELLRVLEARRFPLAKLRLFASPSSAGKAIPFAELEIAVETLSERSFTGVDLALFSAGSGVAREHAPLAVRDGAVVIDNSSAFRMDPTVPLVVPEINAAAIATHPGIIANPNCAAVIALMAMAPIHRQTHPPRDPRHLSGGLGGRWRSVAGTARRDPRSSRRRALRAPNLAAPLSI